MADAIEYYDDDDFLPLKPARKFTYGDYASRDEEVRYELIDGIAYMMAPPGRWHQLVVGELHGQLWDWLKDKPCEVYVAPFGVRLFAPPGEDDITDQTVVEPDVLVVCDTEKLSDGKACRGAPDFVVEVISESTRGKDFGIKKNRYREAGVAEYWLVEKDAVYRNLLVGGEYRETVHAMDEGLELEVGVLPGCTVHFRRMAGKRL